MTPIKSGFIVVGVRDRARSARHFSFFRKSRFRANEDRGKGCIISDCESCISMTVNVSSTKYILLLNAGISLVQDVTHSFTGNGWEEAYALALFFYPDIMLVS